MLSIKETRKILGEEYKDCSDDEIEKKRDSAYFFADIFLEGIIDASEVADGIGNVNKLNNKK